MATVVAIGFVASLRQGIQQQTQPRVEAAKRQSFERLLRRPLRDSHHEMNWNLFHEPGGDFNVELPGEFMIAPDGGASGVFAVAAVPSAKCLLTYQPLPPSLLAAGDDQAILSRLVDAARQRSSAVVEPTHIQQFHGLRIEPAESRQLIVNHLLLIRGRLLSLSVTAFDRNAMRRLDRIFESLRVLIPYQDSGDPQPPYLERLSNFKTELIRRGPSPATGPLPTQPPAGLQKIRYQSGKLSLWAWLSVPPGKGPFPAMVFCHGDYKLNASVVNAARPLMDAGFVVLFPALRGENGNPGFHELFLGEVDDAAAAVRWIARQPFTDSSRVYAFGHSLGGGVVELLSLRRDVPLIHSASSGSLYARGAFRSWGERVPFNRWRRDEEELRLLVGNIREMQRPHWSIIGAEDAKLMGPHIASARAEAKRAEHSRLTIETVPGDHMSSLQPAVERYLAIIRKNDDRKASPVQNH
jgi:dienelactone hydrolase